MIKYKTTGIIDITAGVSVGLTDAQAKSRKRNLEPLGQGVYRVLTSLQFKAGEIIKLSGVSKQMLACLECMELKKLDARAKAKAEADKGSGSGPD